MKHAGIAWCLAMWLAGAAWCDPEADRAIAGLMRKEGSERVRILHRAQVSDTLDLVVALGGPNWLTGPWWNEKTRLGVLLQHRVTPGLLYKIVVQSGEGPSGDCYASVERATSTDVVIYCTPEKGPAAANHKFVFSLQAKSLVKEVVSDRFSVHRIFPDQDKLALVASDRRRLVALEYDPLRAFPVRILHGAQANRWLRRVDVMRFRAGNQDFADIRPEEIWLVSFGPDGAFQLHRQPEGVWVTERTGGRMKKYALPRTTYDQFATVRPKRVANGFVREATTIHDGVGPCQVVDGRLWFAKSFYDAEGITGVGGFGYFDTEQRRFQIYSPAQIRDQSTTAMLVEAGAVWLGLAHHGEWRTYPGGLLRFDRATGQSQHLPMRDVIGAIGRSGQALVMATEAGIAAWEDGRMRRFLIDETTDGRLRVAEAIGGSGTFE
jgi:hypothetical protein